jgi:cytochrome P450
VSTDVPSARPDAAVPTGPAFLALDPAFRERPHEILEELRRREPVHRDQVFDRVVLTRAKDIESALSDRSLSVDPRTSRPGAYVRLLFNVDETFRPTMLHMDDPDHRRLRGLVAQAFTPRIVEAMRPRVAEIASALLDDVDPSRPFDVMPVLADPLPTIVIAAMLGVDPAHTAAFKAWSDALMLRFNPKRTEDETQRLERSTMELRDYLMQAVAARRQCHTEDLLSRLIAAEEDGEQLSPDEIVETCGLLLVAGNVTTTDLIGNGVLALLRHPGELAKLRAGPELIATAVEEILRYDPPIMASNRQAPSAREIDGCPVEAGQTLTLMLAAANHDPALHDDPHRFDISRADKRHLSFGNGAHFCLGASLARLEAQVALSTLITRFPGLRLSQERGPERRIAPILNGLTSLWVIPS